jgi:hypothetical protein
MNTTKTRADIMEAMLACDERKATLKSYIDRAKAMKYTDGKHTKYETFWAWVKEWEDQKRLRVRLQHELGELNRAEKRAYQLEADRQYFEKLRLQNGGGLAP